MLGFCPLELIEDKVSERIEDHAAPVMLNRLGDVRMMADHEGGAGINGGVRELNLHLVGFGWYSGHYAWRQLRHRPSSTAAATSLCIVGISSRATRQSMSRQLPLLLVEGIGEKAKANTMPFQHHASVRLFRGFAGTNGFDLVLLGAKRWCRGCRDHHSPGHDYWRYLRRLRRPGPNQ